MAHFAEINKDNKVIRVLVFSDKFTNKNCSELLGGVWIKTSYNSNIRKNFAGIGYSYDSVRDAFISPEPENSTGFDEENCQWITPVIEMHK
jgi:hypothetical protein